MKKADLLIASVSAASIIAKVARDDYMSEQDDVYGPYGFGQHVGYGTKLHRDALTAHGITPLHRKSFAPIAALLKVESSDYVQSIKGTTKDAGNKAESVAAKWLEHHGYSIVDRNWKTRFCEIDIVARRGGVTHFVEVKHRKNEASGGGISAITATKHRQMTFAANVYMKTHQLLGSDAVLAVLTTTSDPATFETYLELT